MSQGAQCGPASQPSSVSPHIPQASSVSPSPNTPIPPQELDHATHNYRPLNVRDALSYLDQVKLQFQDLPGVYNQFLDIMKDFKTQTIDTPGVIDGVSSLFRGHPALIQGFNTFLPPGYRIDVSQGEASTQAAVYNLITVTHPTGIQTQKRVPLQSGGEEIGSHILPPPESIPVPTSTAASSSIAPALSASTATDKLTRDNVNSLALSSATPRILAPLRIDASASTSGISTKTKPVTLDAFANHNLAPHRTNSPALSNTTNTDASKSTIKPLEFNHAITYVNKIKNRYSGDPKTYQTFLDILQTYQRDARPIQDVYEQVNHLFRDEPDLMVEFMQFLPDTSGNATLPSLSNSEGLLGVCNSAGVSSNDDRKSSAQHSAHLKPVNASAKKKRTNPHTASNNKANLTVTSSRPTTLEANNSSRNSAHDNIKSATSATLDSSSLRGTKRKAKAGLANAASDLVSLATTTTELPPPGFAPPGYRSIGEAYHATLTSNRALAQEKHTSRSSSRHQVAGSRGVAETHQSKQGHHHHHHRHHHHHHHHHHRHQMSNKKVIAKEEMVFFHHVKTYFADQTTYIEFLKIINLFTQDLIDLNTMVSKVKPFLMNCPDLWTRFINVVGWREENPVLMIPLKRKAEADGELPEPKKSRNRSGFNNTRPLVPSRVDDVPECGPSYRQVPESEVLVACSGRDALCSDVLNDRWVCGPPGLSPDEQLFTPRQTNGFERALYQAEDERHEYDYHIEANVRTIALLEPINLRIQQMDPEHRAEYRLKPGLGGQSKSIYQRIIKKIYGKEHGIEVIHALHESPALAVPIVLARLKQKDEEWKKALRDWNRVWREVDAKNYWKALDHRGISFKAVDKKLIGNKNLVNEIELIKREQQQKRQICLDPSIIQFLPKYQLELDLGDTQVFYDVLKIFIHFLDHVSNSTGLDDAHKDQIENFLKSVVTGFFEIPVAELERHLTPLPPEAKEQENVKGGSVVKNVDPDGNEGIGGSDGDVSDRAGSPILNAVGGAEDDRIETWSSSSSSSRPNRGSGGFGRKRGGVKDGQSGIGSSDLRKKAMKNASSNGPMVSERAFARRSEANRSKPSTTLNASGSGAEDSSLALNITVGAELQHGVSCAKKDRTGPGTVDISSIEIQTSSVRDEGPEPTEGKTICDVLAQRLATPSSDARLLSGQDPPLAAPSTGGSEVISERRLGSSLSRGNRLTVPNLSTHPSLNERPINALPNRRRHNFFTNNAFYCLFRLLHIMYTRLYTLKKASESIHMLCPTSTSSSDSHSSDQQAINTDLLVTTATATAANTVHNEHTCSQSSSTSSIGLTNATPRKSRYEAYGQLLACIQSLNSGQIDQGSFEDECRNLFGVKGYCVVTIDKLCQALVKVLAKSCDDETCKEILRLYEAHKSLEEASEGAGGLTESQKLAYRRSVEALTGGCDTKLYRIEWLPTKRAMRIQLIGGDDISPEDYEAVEKAWSSYIESYGNMAVERTIGLGSHEIKPAFLKRNMRSARKALGSIDQSMFLTEAGLGMRVCMRSYRLFFSANTTDLLFRKRSGMAAQQKQKVGGAVASGEEEDGELVEEEGKMMDVDLQRIRKWETWLDEHSYVANLQLPHPSPPPSLSPP